MNVAHPPLSSSSPARAFHRSLKRFLPLILAAAGLLLWAGCDTNGADSSGTAFLAGRVVNSTGNPVPEALVTATPDGSSALTDSSGSYDLSVDVDSTMDVTLTVEKDGYERLTQTVLARAGETAENRLDLVAVGEEPEEEPGSPTNILLLSQTRSSIGVKESGAPEVSRITFQVADSAGRPIDLDDATQVQFSLGQQPGGGEFIAPESAPTNDNGEVTVNLSSGTKAGVVQVVAGANTAQGLIQSTPVQVSIHGGLPDQDHFTVGPERFNFAGLDIAGLQNPISVIAGDQYGNPVVPGTSVYFTTTGGIIEGSTQTDDQGGGSVNLISGNPRPDDGVAVITAETASDSLPAPRVSDQVPVVFSGPPRLTVSPTNVALNQSYQVTLRDRNENPLAPGTNLTLTAGGTNVTVGGTQSVTLGDTVFEGGLSQSDILTGPGITTFDFQIVKADLTGESPDPETITISTSGPNGSLEIVLTEGGTAHPGTPDTAIEQLPGSTVRAHVERH